jgi:hypothetical protein
MVLAESNEGPLSAGILKSQTTIFWFAYVKKHIFDSAKRMLSNPKPHRRAPAITAAS